MECFGKYYFLDGNIFPVDIEEEVPSGEVSFYEVIRTRGGVPLFFDDHMKRLKDGIATRYDLSDDISEMISEGLDALVRQETFAEINVRITVSFIGQQYSVHICYISSSYPDNETFRNGVPLILYRAERLDPAVKMLNNRLRLSVNEALLKKKAYEALLLNKEGLITEGSRSNVFFVNSKGILYTAPDSMVLSGITRKYVIDICRREGYEIVYEAVRASEIHTFQSAFITGTSPMVLPVKSIEDHLFRTDNDVIKRLILLYRQLASDSIINYQKRKKEY
jgi:branched-chain amino acid aminotransferase